MGEACKVHVGNLSYGVTEDALFAAFEKCGAVDQAIVVTDRESGRPRGFGFVTFQNEESAKKAITDLDGTDLDGRAIKVSESRPRGDGGGRGGGRGYGGGGGGGRGYGGGGGGGGGYRGRSDNYSGGGGGYSRGGSGF